MDIRYVIAAEFDIDVGATVKYHYPEEEQPLFQKENGFANLLIPDQAHVRGEDSGYFCLYNNGEGHLDYTPTSADSEVFYVAHILQTKTGEEIKRGARIYSLAIVAKECFLPVFRPLLLLAIDAYILSPGLARLAELHATLKNMDMSGMPHFSWSQKRILQLNQNPDLFRALLPSTAVESQDVHFYEAMAQYRGLKIPVTIPTDWDFYNYGDFSLSALVELCAQLPAVQGFHKEMTVYGPPTPALIVLWTSILTEKRILLVGDTKTACSELVNLVQACGFFGSAGGLLNTASRVFPYVDLGRMDDLRKAGGYIAGVTNRAFLLHPEWFDLAIHIENKTMELSPRMCRSKIPERFPLHNPIDFELLDKVGRLAQDGNERAVRLACLDYTTSFLRRSALGDLEKLANSIRSRSDPTPAVLGEFGHFYANQAERAQFSTVYVTVFNSWKRHPSYAHYLRQVSLLDWPQPPKPLVDFANLDRRLQVGKMSAEEAAEVYESLCSAMQDDDDISLFLAETNNVYYVNLGLYHPSSSVRNKIADLMLRIKRHPAGMYFYADLPPYHAVALERAERKML